MSQTHIGMHPQELKSFKITDHTIEFYADQQAEECVISLPRWLFNQVVEACFLNVKVMP